MSSDILKHRKTIDYSCVYIYSFEAQLNNFLQNLNGQSLILICNIVREGHKEYITTAECNKVVSDIFGKFEFLMKYQNMSSYRHFAKFLKVTILFPKY